jgi:hypothetical protein
VFVGSVVEFITQRPVTGAKVQTPSGKRDDHAMVAFAVLFMIVAKFAGAFCSVMSLSMNLRTKPASDEMLVLVFKSTIGGRV